ncbi:DUF3558 domain-containing protein [Streptomyces sp. JNUCC 64]
MQRKAYVPGVAVLLAALLTGCTGGSTTDDGPEDDKRGGPGATAPTAEPGRHRTLPEPCGAFGRGTLDPLLPGVKEIPDEERREKAYEGTATATYDTDRRVGCRWKAESVDATHHLLVDLERVVSYDGEVSDEDRAQEVYEAKEAEADLPAPSTASDDEDEDGADGDGDDGTDGASGSPSAPPASGSSSTASAPAGSATAPDGGTTASGDEDDAEPLPRVLDDLGDSAFVDDALTTSGSAQHREVTVVFRTSNVVVTIGYEAQPTLSGERPDSEDMQDRARKLADRLVELLSE